MTASNQFSYGNEYADLLTGNLTNGYTETNFNRVNDITLRHNGVLCSGLLEGHQKADGRIRHAVLPLPAVA